MLIAHLFTQGDADSSSQCYFDNDDASPHCPAGTVFNDIKLSTCNKNLIFLHSVICTAVEVQMATALAVAGAWIGSLIGSTPSQVIVRHLFIVCKFKSEIWTEIHYYLQQYLFHRRSSDVLCTRQMGIVSWTISCRLEFGVFTREYSYAVIALFL